MASEGSYVTETLFTPAWHWKFSSLLGDFKGEIGYIDEYGLVHLIGKKDPDLSEYERASRIDGPVKSITANNSLGLL